MRGAARAASAVAPAETMLEGLRSSLRLSFNHRRSSDTVVTTPLRRRPVAVHRVAVLDGDTSYLRRVVALSDGAHLVAGGDLNQLFVFAANGDRLCELPHPPGRVGHYDDFVRGLADLGDGAFATANVCSTGGTVLRTWRGAEGVPVNTILIPRERVYALCRVNEGLFVAAVGGDLVFYEHRFGAHLWAVPRMLASKIHSEAVYDLDAHGMRVVTASNDGTAVVWNWETCALVKVLRTGNPVLCCAMSHDTVVLGSKYTIRVYDASSFGCLHYIDNAHDNSVLCCLLWGGYIVTSSLDSTIVVTDRASGRLVSRLALRLPTYDIDMIAGGSSNIEILEGDQWPHIVAVGLGDGFLFRSPVPLL